MSLGPHDAGRLAPAALNHFPARFALRLGIIHGNRMMADLLRAYGETAWGCDVVTVEYTGHEGITAVERTKPDLIVVGHAPPMVDVYTLMDFLKDGSGSVKVIVTTQRITEYFVHRFASHGFHGVVEESSEGIGAVQNAIERVREGRRLVSPRFSFIAAALRANPNAFSKVLTKGQERVLLRIAHAMEDEEIGRCLDMSTRTAKRHRADIMRKLDVHGTPRLIRYCIKAGFSDTCMPPTDPKPVMP
jgi:DNA-binding NarL/FixJ family response regulator